MKLENLEGILEGKWEFKHKYSHYELNWEKITFYLLEGIYDYIIVSNMYQKTSSKTLINKNILIFLWLYVKIRWRWNNESKKNWKI